MLGHPARGCCIPFRNRSACMAPAQARNSWAEIGGSESYRGQVYAPLVPHKHALSVDPMKIDGKQTRSIWVEQRRRKPSASSTRPCCRIALPPCGSTTLDDAVRAIKTMQVRGAPLIGATAAYGYVAGAARRRLRRKSRARLCRAAGDAADRDQSQMGARRDDGGGAQPAARPSASPPPCAAPAKSPTRTSPSTRRSAATG